MGLFMYTNSDLFPENDPYAGKMGKVLGFMDGWGSLFQKRFFQRSYTVIYFLFWCAVLVWFVAKKTVLKVFWACVKATCSCLTSCCTPDTESPDGAHSDDFYCEIFIKPLEKLLDTVSDDYEHEL
jgi:hypothetical protein